MSAGGRKRFGQHFLADPLVVQRIVAAIAPQASDLVVEIGPGRGALTTPLLASGCELHLLEIDRDLAAELRHRLASRPAARVHEGDALRADLGEITAGRPFRLVGNLPYNISTPLLFHVLRWSSRIRDMHFMLQKEVVERMAAAPGGKSWGRLSIMCQYRCRVESLFDVPPQAFRPPPRVQSAMVRLLPHAQPPVAIGSMAAFEALVGKAFTQRRKTLRNALRGLLDADQIRSTGVDPGLRPEMLGLAEYAALARLLD